MEGIEEVDKLLKIQQKEADIPVARAKRSAVSA